MDYVWKFKIKKSKRESFYGNFRELFKSESIKIDGVNIRESSLRYLVVKKNKEDFENKDYIIKKVKVKRNKLNK